LIYLKSINPFKSDAYLNFESFSLLLVRPQRYFEAPSIAIKLAIFYN
jgi:hypothetical protein